MDTIDALALQARQFTDSHFVEVFLGLIFLSSCLGFYAILGLVSRRLSYADRLRAGGGELAEGQESSIRYRERPSRWLIGVEPIARIFVPKTSKRAGPVRQELIHAGYLNPAALSVFYAVKVASAIVAAATMFLGVPILFRRIELNMLALAAMLGLVVGYLVPAYYVYSRASGRKKQIRNGFPDALDLLLVCVEAGLGLEAAIARVGAEISKAHPILSEHFRLVGAELRAGKSRSEALRGLAERTGVDEVRTLVTLLIQSDELGTSMAQSLKVHAFEMRAARLLRAEEKAHKIPTKLAFPLMLGLIPVIMMITLGPAIVTMVRDFVPLLNRGTSELGAVMGG